MPVTLPTPIPFTRSPGKEAGAGIKIAAQVRAWRDDLHGGTKRTNIPPAYLSYDARNGRIPAKPVNNVWTLDVRDALAIAENPQTSLAWRWQIESTRRRGVAYNGRVSTSVSDLAKAIERLRETVYKMIRRGVVRYHTAPVDPWNLFLDTITCEVTESRSWNG